MPVQVYRCPEHGDFEVSNSASKTVRPLVLCPAGHTCGRAGAWVPQVVSFSVEGGTGAQKSPR